MKKANLFNKKILSAGISASLLVSSISVNPCSAYKNNSNITIKSISSSQSRVPLSSTKSTSSNLITKNPTKIILSKALAENHEDLNKSTKKVKFGLQISASNTFEIPKKENLKISEENVFEHFNTESENIPPINQNNQILPEKTDKTELSLIENKENSINAKGTLNCQNNNSTKRNYSTIKNIAKAVATTAILGATAYLSYKYRNNIITKLNLAKKYIFNNINKINHLKDFQPEKCFDNSSITLDKINSDMCYMEDFQPEKCFDNNSITLDRNYFSNEFDHLNKINSDMCYKEDLQPEKYFGNNLFQYGLPDFKNFTRSMKGKTSTALNYIGHFLNIKALTDMLKSNSSNTNSSKK